MVRLQASLKTEGNREQVGGGGIQLAPVVFDLTLFHEFNQVTLFSYQIAVISMTF